MPPSTAPAVRLTTEPARPGDGPDARRVPGIRARTLVAVEVRKMVDTRSGRGLLVGLVGLAIALLALKLLRAGGDVATFENTTMAVTPSLSALLPLVGLVAMTTESTQRSALTTLTLVPRRSRVLAAKFAAALVLAAGVLAAVVALAAAATAVGGLLGEGASFTGADTVVRTTVVTVLLQVVTGAAFGALIPQTALAMAAFVGLPLLWGSLAPELAPGAQPWFDVFAAYDRLGSAAPAADLGHTTVALVVWIALPATIGVATWLRREVR